MSREAVVEAAQVMELGMRATDEISPASVQDGAVVNMLRDDGGNEAIFVCEFTSVRGTA